ncbi:MAG: ATP-binding protein [Reyranella sp.]|nr:ATP-binding protein [Reyranella sp.]
MPAAVADIVDNSIAAQAKNVWLQFNWANGLPTITIRDDGRGMGEAELSDAMRFGGQGPARVREPTDLGRFGLGLKTASFSQCRRLTVATRRGGSSVEVRRWDLDYIAAAARDWHLLKSAAEGSESLLADLHQAPSGTVIVWELLDRLSDGEVDEETSETIFLEAIDRVEEHLSMVFHRYLEGPAPAIRIFINGVDSAHQVKPWDPFMSDHPATIRRPVERIYTRAGIVEVQGFILPHKDRLSAQASERFAGASGWTAHQGIYVYRNKRLLVAGSWLGLGAPRRWTKEEAYKLARLRLDITNAADEDWKVDIRKSTARPPQYLRSRLRVLADDARQLARQVFAHRGNYGARPPEPAVKRVWTALERDRRVTYRIDRKHAAVHNVYDLAGDQSSTVDAMLRIIEETVPVQKIWLDATERGEVATGGFSELPSKETEAILKTVYRDLRRRIGLNPSTARERLMQMEPFNQYPDLVAALPENPEC